MNEKLKVEIDKLKKHIKKTDKVVDFHTKDLETKVHVDDHERVKILIE